jgi:feruloyl esterase
MTVSKHIALAAFTVVAVGAALGLAGYPVSGSSFAAQAAKGAPAATRSDADCTRLANLKIDQVKIDRAVAVPGSTVLDDARRPDMTGTNQGRPVGGLQAFCRVAGSIHPEPGSDIKFEVWMPMQGWNGRYFGANNGGFTGSIRYDDLAAALTNGGAGAASDNGHENKDQRWWVGKPARFRDYGWRASHVLATTAKRVIASFYGSPPAKSYFVGCSNGGRQALIEASRFPEDYDGIVAGAPVPAWTDAGLDLQNVVQAQSAPGSAIRRDQASFIQSEVRRQCDALDGVRDGLIQDPRACKLDYAAFSCKRSSSPSCFSDAQIGALRQIHNGLTDGSGRRLAHGFPPSGSEVGQRNAGWESILSPRGSMMDSLLGFIEPPIAPRGGFDFSKHVAPFKAALAADLDAKPDLSRFFARGGKLIIWHGWADTTLNPLTALAFHDKILAQSGPRARTQMQMFMLPGVQHCAGGEGADGIGQVGAAPRGADPVGNIAAAITAWVESGRRPLTLVGTHGQMAYNEADKVTGPVVERLHCAWPLQPALRRGADKDKASSYICRAPHRG